MTDVSRRTFMSMMGAGGASLSVAPLLALQAGIARAAAPAGEPAFGAGFGPITPKLPLNTNGGGLSYSHSGMYGMYALQESVRQMRGSAPAQVEGAKISVCHGVGGMFMAAGTIIFSNEAP